MTSPPVAPLLDTAQARFITGPVSINVASCDEALAPSVSRAYGCRVAADRSTVTVFLATGIAARVLTHLRAGRPIAVVFSLPATHETLQLKGSRAEIGPLKRGDRALMRAYGQGFADHLRGLGYRDPFTSGMVAPVEYEALAVTFAPCAAFVQTPGPSAGQPLQVTP